MRLGDLREPLGSLGRFGSSSLEHFTQKDEGLHGS